MLFKSLLTILTILSYQAMAQVKSDKHSSGNFTSINIVEKRCSRPVKMCYFYDVFGAKRIQVGYSRQWGLYYQLYDRDGVNISEVVELSPDLAVGTARQLSEATLSCPIRVLVELKKGRIVEIQPSCAQIDVKRVVLVERGDSSHSIVRLYDSEGKEQMTYLFFDSKYRMGAFNVIEGEDLSLNAINSEKIENYIFKVSPACPLIVDYEVNSGKILSASLDCDPTSRIINQ